MTIQPTERNHLLSLRARDALAAAARTRGGPCPGEDQFDCAVETTSLITSLLLHYTETTGHRNPHNLVKQALEEHRQAIAEQDAPDLLERVS